MQDLLNRVENDRELLNELVSIFMEEFPIKLVKLREALARKDIPEVMVISHGLKGMLANLAITQAASSAARLEQMARRGQAAQLQEAFAAFERETRGLLPELQAQLTESRR